MTKTETRPLRTIAQEILREWKPLHYTAKPYVEALLSLDSIEENYLYDSARSVVSYFLANASTWRGETARRIKKELNAMLKSSR